jgi:site-specific recombinase XerD
MPAATWRPTRFRVVCRPAGSDTDQDSVPLVRGTRTLPRILAPWEVDALTSALRSHRDRAMVAAMVLGGLRRCEVIGLRLSDLRMAERRVFIAEGKGGHQRLVPISNRFLEHVTAYLETERPADAGTEQLFGVRRYLDQIACVLRPGSVTGADLALRCFAAFLVETAPEVTSTAQLTRRHLEDYKPWLAKRPGQNKARLTTATLAHRLGTLRMFFVRIDEWGWDEAPARVPMFPGDLPRQNHPLPKGLDDAAAAKLLRAAQADKRFLVRVTVEVLMRTGLRVSEFTGLRSDAVVHIGAGPWLHVPVGKAP